MMNKQFVSLFATLPFVLALTVGIGLLSPTSFAQQEQAEQTPELDLSSPRATLRSFLESMNAVEAGDPERWGDVLECIYHEDIPDAEWGETGPELARNLYDILNSLTLDLEAIPEESEERDLSVVLGTVGEGDEEEEISLDFRLNDDGLWRFSRTRFEAQVEELQEVIEVAEEAAAEEAPPDALISPLLATPRTTMKTFLEAFSHWENGGQDEGLLTLDLSGIPENVRKDRGTELAFRLKDILDRDKIVVYQEIPDTAIGQPYVHLVDPSDTTGRRKIVISPVAIEGTDALEWKFSQATLDDVETMWDEHYQALGIVDGAVEQPPRPLALRMRDWVGKTVPFMLNKPMYLENWQWVGLLVTILLGLIVSRVAGFFLLIVVRRLFRREHMSLDGKLERGFVQPIRVAIMAWVWWLAIRPLGLEPEALSWLKTIVTSISAAAAVWAVFRLVDILGSYIAERAQRSENKYDDMVVPLIVRTLKVFVFAAGVIFVVEMSGGDSTKLLAGLGIGGLAFALAAQDTVGNLFGSVTLLFDRPFQIGDWVRIGDVDGSVESVGMRSTRVRTFYNSLVTVPNSKLTNATIDNYGARRYRRFKTNIGITYDTPPDKIDAFCEGMRELIRTHPYTRKDYFHVYLNTFGDYSLNILLYCFHECPDWSTELRERHRLMTDIIRLAATLGVEFAFPTQTLYMQATEGAPSGEGATQDPLAMGREMARGIVRKGFGGDVTVPPPVNFGDAEGPLDDEDTE